MKLLTLCLILSLVACATGRLAYDFDPLVNFSALKTYALMPEAPPSGDPLIDSDTLLHQRVTDAIERELMLKGYRKVAVEEADFWVAYKALARRKMEVLSNYSYGGMGFRRYPFGYQGDMLVREYDEGNLILDILDPKNRKLYWRATIRDYLSEGDSPHEKTFKINEQIRSMLQGFPPH